MGERESVAETKLQFVLGSGIVVTALLGSGEDGSGHGWDGRGFDGFVLLLHERFVLGLELGDFVLEGLFGIFGSLGSLGNGGLELFNWDGLELCDFGLLVVVAEVEVGWGARWAQVFVGKLLEVVVRSATFVLVAHRVGGAGDVLNGWVSLNAVFGAEVLGVVGGAVNIDDGDGGGGSKVSFEFFPIRLHLFAVSSPRRLELDEGCLSSNACVEGVAVEGHGRGGSDEGAEGEDQNSALKLVKLRDT